MSNLCVCNLFWAKCSGGGSCRSIKAFWYAVLIQFWPVFGFKLVHQLKPNLEQIHFFTVLSNVLRYHTLQENLGYIWFLMVIYSAKANLFKIGSNMPTFGDYVGWPTMTLFRANIFVWSVIEHPRVSRNVNKLGLDHVQQGDSASTSWPMQDLLHFV